MLNEKKDSEILDNVDIRLTTVVVQNPHAANKPGFRDEEKRKADGTFQITLESLLRVAAKITSNTVNNYRHHD